MPLGNLHWCHIDQWCYLLSIASWITTLQLTNKFAVNANHLPVRIISGTYSILIHVHKCHQETCNDDSVPYWLPPGWSPMKLSIVNSFLKSYSSQTNLSQCQSLIIRAECIAFYNSRIQPSTSTSISEIISLCPSLWTIVNQFSLCCFLRVKATDLFSVACRW